MKEANGAVAKLDGALAVAVPEKSPVWSRRAGASHAAVAGAGGARDQVCRRRVPLDATLRVAIERQQANMKRFADCDGCICPKAKFPRR